MSNHSTLTIGIIGGGQLGRMMILAGTPLGLRFVVLTPNPDDPAAHLSHEVVLGDLNDPAALSELCDLSDVVTFEIEHTNTDHLRTLEQRGACIRPSARALSVINDKLVQKQTLHDAGVPVPPFSEAPRDSYPMVQKLRRGGYDGRGVAILHGPADPQLSGDVYHEELVSLDCEIAVLVARTDSGTSRVYPPVEMVFDARANICSEVAMPAPLDSDMVDRVQSTAIAAVDAIGIVGIAAVELFLTPDSQVLVNEIAPRPHNSGHLTIEANHTSQFEQHLRAVAGLPLGSTGLRSPAIMLNLLGASDAHGQPDLTALKPLLEMDDAHVHWYGKAEVRPFRKMGHLTLCADDPAKLAARASSATSLTWIPGVLPGEQGATNG